MILECESPSVAFQIRYPFDPCLSAALPLASLECGGLTPLYCVEMTFG